MSTKILDRSGSSSYTKAEMLAFLSPDPKTRFKILAKQLHPDRGGTAEAFRMLVEARDELEDDLIDLMD